MAIHKWWDYLSEEIQQGSVMLTEDDFWQAVADAFDLDISEIADGDPMEWL